MAMTTNMNFSKKKILWVSLGALVVLLFLLPLFGRPSSPGEMGKCVFCDIVAGKSPTTTIEVEAEDFVVFKDIHPASTYHYLAVPKKHIDSLKTLTKDGDEMVVRMESTLKELIASKGIDTKEAVFGFHVPPFITVNHLHMHGIAPKSDIGFFNGWKYISGGAWFKTVEDARKYLKEKSDF